MDEPLSPSSSATTVRLGVEGLSNLTSEMLPGGAYALLASTPPARYPVLAASIVTAVNAGKPCALVVAGHPELLIERLKSFGQIDIDALLVEGAISIFEMQDEFAKKMFRLGPQSFVQELEYMEVPEHCYLVFDQADDLLALHDVSLALDQIDVLTAWFEHKNITALLTFSRVRAAQADSLNALMDSLQGVARLNAGKQGLELTFDYWQSPEGTVAARNFHLLPSASGLYHASTTIASSETSRVQDEQTVPPPADDPYFFYMDPALGSLAQQLPGIWQRVDTLVGMMHATQGKTGATIVLTFHKNTRLRHLAEAVHTLRLNLGKFVRIVVQEKDASLRYQNEALLLRLGVNLVVHRDVAPARLPLLLESLRGQVFSRDVNIDFEAALASVLPTRLRGYQVADRFVREVDLVLARAETLNIPCALVVGRPSTSRKMADIISNSSVSRAGDLITADAEQCFLFLNGCPQTVLLNTLQRILGVPVEDALSEVRFLVTRDDITLELNALVRAVERSTVPDYSALVSSLPEPEMPETEFEEVTAAAPDALPPPVDTYTAHMRQRVHSPAREESAVVAAPATIVRTSSIEPEAVVQIHGDVQYSYNEKGSEKRFGTRQVPRAVRSVLPAEVPSPPARAAAK